MAKITFPIEATHILMFARAIGDQNPVYHDAEKAKDTDAGGIIAPPTFTAAVAQFNPDGSRPRPGEKWFGSGKGPTGIEGKAPSAGGLNAEQHFEYFRPVRPGEVLTAETRPGRTWERESKRAGKLLFSEAKVDAHTGQVTLRGEFPNPKRELLPGMYVRVSIEQGIDTDAIAVPQQAIQRNGGGGSEVFVVKADNRVATQPVRVGSLQDGQWFVTEGLKAGDRVVVEGFQKFVAGDEVKPHAWMEATAQAEATPSAKPTTQAHR